MDTRKQFEEACRNRLLLGEYSFRRFDFGPRMYSTLKTAELWVIWQAAIAHAVPEDHVVVPKEPTHEMITAGRNTPCTECEDDSPEDYRIVYQAMIAAAPAIGEKG